MLLLVDEFEFGGRASDLVKVNGWDADAEAMEIHAVSTVCGILQNTSGVKPNTFRMGYKLKGLSKKDKYYVVESPDGINFEVPVNKIAVPTLQKDWGTTPLALAFLEDNFGVATLLTMKEWQEYSARSLVAGARNHDFEVGGIYVSKHATHVKYTKFVYLGKYRKTPVFAEMTSSVAVMKMEPVHRLYRLPEIGVEYDSLHYVDNIKDASLIRDLQLYATCLQASFSSMGIQPELEEVSAEDFLSDSFVSQSGLQHIFKNSRYRRGTFNVSLEGVPYEMDFTARVVDGHNPQGQLLVSVRIPRVESVINAILYEVSQEYAVIEKKAPKSEMAEGLRSVITILRNKLASESLGTGSSIFDVLLPPKGCVSLLKVALRPFKFHVERFESVLHYKG